MGNELIVTVFGSSRPREGDADYEEARVLGRSTDSPFAAGVTAA